MLEFVLNTTSKQLDFEHELLRLGPEQAIRLSLTESRRYCSRWARQHYENFLVATVLLPRPLRQDFHNIYAFCRWSDNLADEIAGDQQSYRLLKWWEGELEACAVGQRRHPIFVALGDTIDAHQLSLEPFRDLLSAFRQDRAINRYEDSLQLLDYCRRSANPVGRILLELAGTVTTETVELSDQICTGLQMANFCQDLSRDAAQGRIYAPRTLWRRHGVEQTMLLNRVVTDELQSMLAEWVGEARAYLVAGWPLVDRVPSWLKTDVDLFVRGGMAILEVIERQGFDVWTNRPRVSKWRQGYLCLRSIVANARLTRWVLDRPVALPADLQSSPSSVAESESHV